MSNKILVWDFPTRTFHWLLALSFVGAFITGDSERYRDIHLLLGYILLALIGFRLIWGVVGTRYARFNSFWFKPSAVIQYVARFSGTIRAQPGRERCDLLAGAGPALRQAVCHH